MIHLTGYGSIAVLAFSALFTIKECQLKEIDGSD
jgi:hypothetical protein